MHVAKLSVLGAAMLTAVALTQRPPFEYRDPGDLVPGSGHGLEDWTVYQEGLRFPLEDHPAYANSQVWSKGGISGPGGHECDPDNYSYPWRDNYCETRRWSMSFCPAGRGHQGQDIRPATCENGVHWAVAAETGSIADIGDDHVVLIGETSGVRYRYFHLDHDQLAVQIGQEVHRGQRIGLVSDNADYNTTTHLHFDMYSAGRYFPTYMSLVVAYEALLDGRP